MLAFGDPEITLLAREIEISVIFAGFRQEFVWPAQRSPAGEGMIQGVPIRVN
jgi:hypothetical protein